MRDTIATLPWVETESIKTDAANLQVRFTIIDLEQFQESIVVEKLKRRGYSGAKLIAGPTLAEPSPATGKNGS